MNEKYKEILKEIVDVIVSLAVDCSQHLREQHHQEKNDTPRCYFENIEHRMEELRRKIDRIEKEVEAKMTENIVKKGTPEFKEGE